MNNDEKNIYDEKSKISNMINYKNNNTNDNKIKNQSRLIVRLIYFSLFIYFVIICYLINIHIIIKKTASRYDKIINNIHKRSKFFSNIKSNNNNKLNLLEVYKKEQNDFCENPSKYINQEYEKEIYLIDVNLNELKYKMYMFKPHNYVEIKIKKNGAYEKKLSENIMEALKFYSLKYKILNNKDITILDIGGNVGWYPSLLGRYGFTILSFEAFDKNYYISKKNFCYLNRNSNVIIITKGLGNEDRICNYFRQKNNEGNGMVLCDNKYYLEDKKLNKQFERVSKVEITTLKSFLPYLSEKKIVLMKLDVEGNELQVLEGGKELITEYHVPFIVLEFSPSYLKEIGSDPKKLLQFFIDNGYKISLDGFLSKKYITINDLLSKVRFQVDCYFIHNSLS